MTLSDLRIFVALVEEGSFSRAAVRTCRTQPAVSQAVARLERHLEQRLLGRSFRAISLTDAGRLLHQHALKLCELHREAEGALERLRDRSRDRLTIGASGSAMFVLLPLLTRFRDRYRTVPVDIRHGLEADLVAGVVSGAFDLAAVASSPLPPTLEYFPIGSDEIVVLLRREHPLAARPCIRPKDIVRESLVVRGDPGGDDEMRRVFVDGQPHSGALLSVPGLEAVVSAVEFGLGVGIVQRSSIAQRPGGRRLVTIPFHPAAGVVPLHLVFVQERHRTPSARAFVGVARESMDVSTVTCA